jgi:hypothetical protein
MLYAATDRREVKYASRRQHSMYILEVFLSGEQHQQKQRFRSRHRHAILSQRLATSFLERDVFHTPGYASLVKHCRSRRGAQWVHAASRLRLMLAVIIFVSKGLESCVFTRCMYVYRR